MASDYKPINCNLYDVLLDRATRKVEVELVYKDGESIVEKAVVFKDVYTKSGEEYLVLNSGEHIRLDKIVSLDGKPFEAGGYC